MRRVLWSVVCSGVTTWMMASLLSKKARTMSSMWLGVSMMTTL